MHTHAAVARRCRLALPAAAVGLATCFALGCGDDSSSPQDPDGGDGGDGGLEPDAGANPNQPSCEGASGDRIRQVVREHGDGSSEFVRLHDTDFAETCRFGAASDGVLRCLPEVDGTPFAAGVLRYTEDTCTTRIAQLDAPAGATPPAYMRENVAAADPCAAQTPVFYELGKELVIPPKTAIFQRDGTGCVTLAAPAADFFAIAADLPPETFVEGTETYTDSGRLALAQVDGADGSRFCAVGGRLRDRDLADRACQVELAEDGSLRCLPDDVNPSQAFTDAVCTVPVDAALVDQQCNAQATYLMDPAGAECSLRQAVRTVGDPLPAPIFQFVADVCVETVPAEQLAHEIGPSVSSFSFAELTRASAPAGDRLERSDLVTGDGLRLSRFEWLDTELDQLCAFVPAADGAERCLPIASPLELTALVTRRFTESTCTTEVVVATRDPSCAEGEPRYLLEQLSGLTRVYQVGPVQPGPLFELGKTCVEIPAEVTFYQLGPEILPQTFVGGTEMVE
jgi:hypothetical protein